MTLYDELQKAEGNAKVCIRITDTRGVTYTLLHQLAGNAPVLPTANLLMERRLTIETLVRDAFGSVRFCDNKKGNASIDATGAHLLWCSSSGPFFFTESEVPTVVALLPRDPLREVRQFYHRWTCTMRLARQLLRSL